MKVYMPYDDRSDETTAGYRQILGNLQASIEYLTSDNMGIVGDFNVDPGRGRLWHYLYDFIQSNELVNIGKDSVERKRQTGKRQCCLTRYLMHPQKRMHQVPS